jgi:RNA polymerase sigma factor for flagellar operon FliA
MATDDEIAKSLGISEEDYLSWQSQMKITGVVSLNEFMESISNTGRAKRAASV